MGRDGDFLHDALAELEQLRLEQRSRRSSVMQGSDTTAEGPSHTDVRRRSGVIAEQSTTLNDHLAFHGNPLDRPDADDLEDSNLPLNLKTSKANKIMPVNGRMVFVVKDLDLCGNLTFLLFYLGADAFWKHRFQFFPESSTHLLGKVGKSGWRFVANLNTGNEQALAHLQKLEPRLCSVDIREMAMAASLEDTAIAGQAVALVQWNMTHQFCPQCGGPTVPARLGSTRRCTMFEGHPVLRPQTQPVVVVLLQSPDKHSVLLGRSKGMRPQMINCLSGFIGQCESIAEAVQRVVRSSVGVEVLTVTVQGSQPWPAGQGSACELLIGALATATHTATSYISGEVEEAYWFTRESLQTLLKHASAPGHPVQARVVASSAQFYLPPPVTISHALMIHWVDRQ